MKKRILAMLLVIFMMMLSAAVFVSCGGEEDEDLGEEMEVKVTVRIVGDDGYVLVNDLTVTLEGYAKNLTVLAATFRALDASEIEYDYDTDRGQFQSIGDYALHELRVSDYDDDEDEDEDDEHDTIDYFWAYTLNGREATMGAGVQTVVDEDFVEWNFAETEW